MTSTPAKRIPHYRADIDGLRAIAILLVLTFHAFPSAMPGGFIGVDVFFVISGYLITGIVLRGLEKDTFSFLHFYVQRARRLLPALALLLPATLIAGWIWLWPQEYEQLSRHVAAASVFLLNIVLWTEAGYFDAATELKPLMHLWSLGIEEQFYLIYPCLLWLGWRMKLKPVWVIAGLVIASFTASLLTLRTDAAGAFFLPHTRFWELALGGLLAWYFHGRAQVRGVAVSAWQHALPWLGLAIIAIGAWAIRPGTPYPGTAALLPVFGSMMLIAAGPGTWVNRKLLASRGMVAIGLISYPLYLWHWPILSFLRILHSDTVPLHLRWAAIAATFLLAWATYKFVETPIRFGDARNRRIAGVITASALCATISLWLVSAQGLPQRLPEDARTLLTYRYDHSAGYREGTCFLEPDQTAEDFRLCPDEWDEPGESWLLWGDSHTAHLHPGIDAVYGRTRGIVQRSASGCPPLEGESFVGRPNCAAIQEHIWEEIAQHRPKRVSLAAMWDQYDWNKLEQTVTRLKQLNVETIELIGPVPQWHNGLPRQVAIAYRKGGFKEIPLRLDQGLRPAPFEIDTGLRIAAERWGVEYFSPIEQLCNSQGCLTRNPDATGELAAWDDCHLTASGSQFLAPLLVNPHLRFVSHADGIPPSTNRGVTNPPL